MAGREPGCWWVVSPSISVCVLGSLPFFLENLGRQECGRLPWDNGPLSCRVAAGPQTIGWGRALSRCPRPETDAREPPVGAPEVTSLELPCHSEEEPWRGREENNGGLMPGARPLARVGGSPGRPRPGRCCYCVGVQGPSPGVSWTAGRRGLGLEARLSSREDPADDLAGPLQSQQPQPCTWPLKLSFRKAITAGRPQAAPGFRVSDFMTGPAAGPAWLGQDIPS